MNTEIVLILVTCADIAQAEQISLTLVQKKLIACSNIFSDILSIFRWKGELCQEKEVLMTFKSVSKNFSQIVREVKRKHSYENPEIIAIPIIDGAEDYLNWVKTETE